MLERLKLFVEPFQPRLVWGSPCLVLAVVLDQRQGTMVAVTFHLLKPPGKKKNIFPVVIDSLYNEQGKIITYSFQQMEATGDQAPQDSRVAHLRSLRGHQENHFRFGDNIRNTKVVFPAGCKAALSGFQLAPTPAGLFHR